MHTACQTLMLALCLCNMTSTSPRDNKSMSTEAAGLLLMIMSEQALLIQKNASQVGGTNMAAQLKMSRSGW